LGEGGRLGSGVSIHKEALLGGGEEGLRTNWVVAESERDLGGIAAAAGMVVVVALTVAGREENLMSLSCSSGDGRLTGSISQSWSRLLPTVGVKRRK
jgi:hypothetical protein